MSVERLAPAVRELLRAEIAAALGREVSFVARLDANGRGEPLDAHVLSSRFLAAGNSTLLRIRR